MLMWTCWRNSFRYLVVTIGFFCLLSVNSNHTIINFTFICMSSDYSKNFSGSGKSPPIDYTPSEKSAVIWAVPLGTLLGSIPVNYFYTQYGAKWPFLVAGVVSALATAMVPAAAVFNLKALMVLRFTQGLAFAGNFGARGLICVRWAALTEMSIFLSVLTSFTPVSAVITNPVAAWMCKAYGWPMAFYAHAVFGLTIFLLWVLLYTDDPQKHHIVTKKELTCIQKGKTKEHVEGDRFVPYKEIILDRVVLIIWLNAFCCMTALTFVLTYAPLYFRKVLKYDVGVAGTLSSVASSIHLPLKLASGIISDRLNIISERYKMWFFNTISIGVAGLCILLIGIFPPDWPTAGFAMFVLDNTVMALTAGAFYKCGTLYARYFTSLLIMVVTTTSKTVNWYKTVSKDKKFGVFNTLCGHAPNAFNFVVEEAGECVQAFHNDLRGQPIIKQYSHVIVTVIQFMKCVGMFVAAALFWLFVKDESNYNEWRYAYWLQGSFLIIANILFYAVATDQPAAFTLITRATGKDEPTRG